MTADNVSAADPSDWRGFAAVHDRKHPDCDWCNERQPTPHTLDDCRAAVARHHAVHRRVDLDTVANRLARLSADLHLLAGMVREHGDGEP